MTKNKPELRIMLLWFFAVLLLGGLGGVLLERLVLPYFGILGPATPVVVTKREEIIINEAINNAEVLNRAKPSLATLYLHEGEFASEKFRLTASLSGLVVASDGVIVSPLVSLKTSSLVSVMLSDQQIYSAKILATDTLTGTMFSKVEARDLPVAKQGFSQELAVGDRLLAISTGASPAAVSVHPLVLIRKSSADPSLDNVHDFNRLDTALAVSPVESLPLGTMIYNKDGQLVGLVTQTGKAQVVLRSEDLKLALDKVLAGALQKGKIIWPTLKLSYLILDEALASLLKLSKNAGIQVQSGSSALRAADFIFAVNDQSLSLPGDFQQTLLAKRPGEKVKLKLLRNGEELEVELSL